MTAPWKGAVNHQKGETMLIDFHTHCFPDNLAPKALPPLAMRASLTAKTDGTFGGLYEKETISNVDKFVTMNIATKSGSMRKTNDFAISVQRENVYSYGTVFPDDEGALDELDYVSQNMYGLKLHPDYQNFFCMDEKYFPIYEKCEKLSLPVLFHPGYDPVSPDVRHCPVEAIKVIAESFPKLKIIAAHMGGMNFAEQAKDILVGLQNVYFDTSMSYYYVTQKTYEYIILSHGPERILFATDSPWSTVEDEMGMLRKVPLSDEEMDMILFKNAEYLLARRF